MRIPLIALTLAAALAAPPAARKSQQVDDYHGVKIADPYRWMEDTDSAETRQWIQAENAYTQDWLKSIPQRASLKQRLGELYQFERMLSWIEHGGHVFYLLQGAGKNQPVLYLRTTGRARALIDLNTIDPTGLTAMGSFSVSRDGRYIAYSLAKAGSDWVAWHTLDVAAGKNLPEALEWSKFSTAEWDHEQKGFYYGRYPKPENGLLTSSNVGFQLYYHRASTPQSDDKLVYERSDHPGWRFVPKVSDDGRYLVLKILDGTSTQNRMEYIALDKPGAKPVTLVDEFYASLTFLGCNGDVFYVWTNYGAPRGRIVAVGLKKPQREQWTEVVAEANDTLQEAQLAGGTFVLSYLHDVMGKVVLRPLQGGAPRELPLPANASISLTEDSHTIFAVHSFTTPESVYRCDTKSCLPVRPAMLPFDPALYETRQIFFPSKDGVTVPMFLVHRKGLVQNGGNPTLLYGYGGFNISTTPSFRPLWLAWMERGGLVAVANMRGGGEYGEQWHQAGMKDRKQNVFDDFIAAAEWLIANNYTRRDKLAIQGGSNGGLLVGTVLNQRPDLFGAAVPAVGVMDMLRFHKFTIGYSWTPEFGSPETAEDFRVIVKYSPLHNIKPGTRYPPTLILTADHDDRVVPGHSFKYAAALQSAQAGDAPILIRIETSAGHGAGKPVSKRVEEGADILAFLTRTLQLQ